jgi:signal transduction histidine kinase
VVACSAAEWTLIPAFFVLTGNGVHFVNTVQESARELYECRFIILALGVDVYGGLHVSGCAARERALIATNRELEHAREAAEQATRAKGEFLANMSREIRTAMNDVIGGLELTGETDSALPPSIRATEGEFGKFC